MIKVDKITIEEFRGLRNVTLEFHGHNFAVCGPNGTGKSGVVDALEFALTGNISRLSGEGMGNVSVEDHAPHVDSRNNPERAKVTVNLKIPSLGNQEVILERSVKGKNSPKITPATPEVMAVLDQFVGHPEFVLSRREIIRYVISQPGNRSEEVQALLRLDSVGEMRLNLKTVSNSCERELKDFSRVKIHAGESLSQALEIIGLDHEKIIEAANIRRVILGLAPLTELTSTTVLNDGLESGTKTASTPKINKALASEDAKKFSDSLKSFTDDSKGTELQGIRSRIISLASNPIASAGASRESFLRKAIDLITENFCPLCGTSWDMSALRKLVLEKISTFDEVTKIRKELERQLIPFVDIFDEMIGHARSLANQFRVSLPAQAATISAYLASLSSVRRSLIELLPFADAVSAIDKIIVTPKDVGDSLDAINKLIASIPEPTKQEAARDFLVRAQDRLETLRDASRNAKKAQQRSELAKQAYETYTDVSNKALDAVYKEVEADFSSLYCSINNDDETGFTAKLTPSIGRLAFDVDFYGRGHFPPGAYHSEGHQDAMGLCLYLALMKKLHGDNFKFAVLDDVLMSVDVLHRREVCNLLKRGFPDTQFVLTTHDEVWMKQMKSVGLIPPGNSVHFSNWTPDHGPEQWKTRDIWSEIDNFLKANDVRSAAGSLRYYSEHVFREICESIRARVEFKGDGRYELGDTLTPAVRRFRDLILMGAKAAEAWGQHDIAEAIKQREKNIGESLIKTSAEQWQINPAIHYNEWANLSAADFVPVSDSFRDLISKFICETPGCGGMYYLTVTSSKIPDSLRCSCGKTNISLKSP